MNSGTLRHLLVRSLTWRGRLRRPPGARVLEALVWAVPLTGLEFLGRRAAADAIDAFGVVLLSFLALMAWVRFERALRRMFAHPAVERLRKRITGWIPEAGLDFRRTPALATGMPRVVVVLFAATLIAAAAAAVTSGAWPTGARSFLRSVSGLLYLTYLSVLWGALLVGTIGLFLLPLAYLRAELMNSRRWRLARRRLELPAALAWLAAVSLAAWLLPHAWALSLLLGGLALFAPAACLPPCRDLMIAWRPPTAPAADMRTFRWSTWLCGSSIWLAAACILLAVLARGDRFSTATAGLEGTEFGTTAVTAFLGLAFLWCAAGGCAYVFVREGVELLVCCRADPARPAPVRIALSGAVDAAVLLAARADLGRAGFATAVPGDRARPTDVRVRLTDEDEPFPSGWPAMTPGERSGVRSVACRRLADPKLHESLRRRGEILRRRELYGRLRAIFKHAAARKPFEKGEGFWVAPHLWFITRLARDSDDPDTWFFGPTYRRAIDRAARHHLNRVLDALEIDLIFVEDGVGFRGLKRVLALAFEYYDMFGGRRLDDERPFAGIPGVRVLIQDYEIETPWRNKRYPEPDYEEVGRARILLLFKERGDGDAEEQDVEPEVGLRLPRARGPRRRVPVLR